MARRRHLARAWLFCLQMGVALTFIGVGDRSLPVVVLAGVLLMTNALTTSFYRRNRKLLKRPGTLLWASRPVMYLTEQPPIGV